MNHSPLIFLGAFLALAMSWYGFVVGPVLQLGRLEPVALATGGRYPTLRAGLAQQGADVYRANGCNYCHTQQVQAAGRSSDLERGWGVRASVAQDYIYENPVMLGSQRVGQDLAHLAGRNTNELWHLQHLYNPQIVSPGSVMPPYPYLFERRKIEGRPSADALELPEKFKAPAGYEIVPKREARALLAYLTSLNTSMPLFEAPLPAKATDTNQPAAPAVAPAPGVPLK